MSEATLLDSVTFDEWIKSHDGIVLFHKKLCPNCKQFTFFKTVGENRECTKCGYKMVVPIQSKGRGERCPNCGKLTVQNQGGRKCCTNCGATFKGGKNG